MLWELLSLELVPWARELIVAVTSRFSGGTSETKMSFPFLIHYNMGVGPAHPMSLPLLQFFPHPSLILLPLPPLT